MKKLLLSSLLALSIYLPIASAELPFYTIYNNSDYILYFQTLDPTRGTWRNQQVNPHENKKLTMNTNAGSIRITTPTRGYNEYTVGAAGQYRLTWDAQKQMWDIKTDKASGATTKPNRSQQQSNLPYRLGDAVLVYAKNKWHNATVIQLNSNQIRVHYNGYDSQYDEWVNPKWVRYP